MGLFALFWFAVVILGPLSGLASKANAQVANQGGVLFDSCYVKGARVTNAAGVLIGIKYSVHVQVTVDHPAFANPATTAFLRMSDSSTPPVVFIRPLITNGGERTGNTGTPGPTILNPTFPIVAEVVISNGNINVLLALSSGSRARIVPAIINSPITPGPVGDIVEITGNGNMSKDGIKTPFRKSLPANKTGDFVEEFQVTDWWDMSTNSYKPFRVDTFQGARTTPILTRLYQLKSGFKRHSAKPLVSDEFTESPTGDWGTSFNSDFFKSGAWSKTTLRYLSNGRVVDEVSKQNNPLTGF